MLRFHPSRFIWVLALMLGMWMVGSQAQEYRYHYVSLHELVPVGFDTFDPVKITNSGRVYGTLYTRGCDDWPIKHCRISIAVYDKGALTALQAGAAFAANESDTIGGAVLKKIDPNNFPYIIYQAALIRGNKVQLIPRQQGELSSVVRLLSDLGTAQVESIGGNPQNYLLYPNGQMIPVEFGDVLFPQINNQDLIAGTKVGLPGGDRAFLFNPLAGEMMLLNPLPPDKYSWGMDINNHGDVLGYSFKEVPTELTRIGVWSSQGKFETYLDKTTLGKKFRSDLLCFNDNNLIVISGTNDGKIYLVPEPGVLLNLTDLVDHSLPGPETAYWTVIRDVNNYGDMIGEYSDKATGMEESFLLLRVGPGSQ